MKSPDDLEDVYVRPEVTWSARAVQALRAVRGMSQREFASHLGYAQSTVVNWEKQGRTAQLHHETREVLTRDLDGLSRELREEFDRKLGISGGALGAGSAARTSSLLRALHRASESPLTYHPPVAVMEEIREFLESSARVFLLTGDGGTGKTRLSRHAAAEFGDYADFQLLDAGQWELEDFDLAVEILRYASLPRRDDALLTVEEHSQHLARPCIVVIDGITSRTEFSVVGQQVDVLLRQVTAVSLRFLIAVRTPPTIETTPHPMLHAVQFTRAHTSSEPSRQALERWTLVQARRLWESQRLDRKPAFDTLPTAIQQLIRTPLFMDLALRSLTDSPGRDLTTYALLDLCVRRIVANEGAVVDEAMAAMTALACRQSPDFVPAVLASGPEHSARETQNVTLGAGAVLHRSPHGRASFAHDVLREFFLSTRIAELMHSHGRSITTVRAFNDLAARAAASGAARSIASLVIQRLDHIAPDILVFVVTAPTASATTTVPLILSLAEGAVFASGEVLVQCARLADHEEGAGVGAALLGNPAVHTALGHDCSRWILALLRRFGTQLWPAITAFIERNFTTSDAHTLIDSADLAHGTEATFFARHFHLFFSGTTQHALEEFLGHPNWRVRAALAEGLADHTTPLDEIGSSIMAMLVADADLKVRAAIAPTVIRAPEQVAHAHLATLLTDENWHVRDRTLRGLLQLAPSDPATEHLATTALEVLDTEPSWSSCPGHIRPTWQRLRILYNGIADCTELPADDGDHRALLTVLREIHTDHLQVPITLRDAVIAAGLRDRHWLVRHEARQLDAHTRDATTGAPRRLSRERFRRTRGHRAVQVALDMHHVDDAIAVARAASCAGADFIEVGDPLIKEVGIGAIEQIKTAVPDATIVAEMMSADWGRDQVVLAAEAGADIVLLIGPATTASVSAAVEAGQRLGLPIILDTPAFTRHSWITDMERAGVDGFAITANIDIGIGSPTSLDIARTLRSRTQLPIAVSGGYSTTDHDLFACPDWDIVIVGRSVADAVDPATSATRIIELVHNYERHR